MISLEHADALKRTYSEWRAVGVSQESGEQLLVEALRAMGISSPEARRLARELARDAEQAMDKAGVLRVN